MQADEVLEKIEQLRDDLLLWEKHLKEIQNNCNHHYQDELFYQKCLKCQKTEALYY